MPPSQSLPPVALVEQVILEYSDTLVNNGDASITGSTFTTLCNDAGGYAIYAVGYSNNTLGNTDLIFNNTPSSTNNITTSSSPASGASYWQMKLTAAAENQPVLENGYGNYSAIPSSYTKIASYSSITDPASSGTRTGQSVTAHYYAHASATQPAGTYTGAVKYTMVHPGNTSAPIKMIDDLEYMQDFATLTSAEKTSVLDSMGTEATYTLKDKRDEQEYTIAKLKDGKVWMTENLNIAGNTLLSSDMTDFDSNYNLPVNQGWQSDGKLPISSTSGFDIDNYAYVYNSNSKNCENNNSCYSYYSWDVATLGSGRNISIDNTDAPYSICPKGWYLPSTYNGTNSSADFRAMGIAYGGSGTIQIYNSTTNPTGAEIYDSIKAGTAMNILLAGRYLDSEFIKGGGYGMYWSSTSSNSNEARYLAINPLEIHFSSENERRYGFSVRCLVRQPCFFHKIWYDKVVICYPHWRKPEFAH